MSLKQDLFAAIQKRDTQCVETLVVANKRSLRFLLAWTYHDDARIRQGAAHALGFAAGHYPESVQDVARRLIWAMNDESGTNGKTAPEVLLEIAKCKPNVLLPLVPDLTRLTQDEGLKNGLAEALKTVMAAFPGEVGRRLSLDLNKKFSQEKGNKKCGCGGKNYA